MDIAQKIKLIIFVGLGIAAVVGGVYIATGGRRIDPFYGKNKTMQVKVGNASIEATIARTKEEQEIGLSEWPRLPQDEGMLFVYKEPVIPSFWMKGMKFPIDIIWIREGRVIGVHHRVSVASGGDLPTYSPKEKVDTVLEVNAGWAAAHNVTVGSTAQYK